MDFAVGQRGGASGQPARAARGTPGRARTGSAILGSVAGEAGEALSVSFSSQRAWGNAGRSPSTWSLGGLKAGNVFVGCIFEKHVCLSTSFVEVQGDASCPGWCEDRAAGAGDNSVCQGRA